MNRRTTVVKSSAAAIGAAALMSLVGVNPAHAEQRGIDLTRACRTQYGQPSAVASLVSRYDAYSWYCQSASNGPRLGGIDIARACRDQYGQGWTVGLRNRSDAFTWYCESPGPPYGVIGPTAAYASSVWDVNSAMQWAVSQQGNRTWEPNSCLNFTWKVYTHDRTVQGRGFGSAIAAWNGNPTKHPNDRRPPYGAIVYYAANAGNGYYGHAAMSLGDGRIVSNNVGANGTVNHTSGAIGITTLDAFVGYLGWGQFDG